MKTKLTAENQERLASFLVEFGDVFREKLDYALRSGAISEDADFGAILKCVAVITGESFMPLHQTNKIMLRNLRHFV